MGGKNTATLLVDIAEDLFTFGCMSPGRRHPGDPEPVVHEYACPKGKPDMKRPLADIRPDLAAVYEATHGEVPSKSALGDAMTVLAGRCRQSAPEEAADSLLARFAGGSAAKQLLELAHELYEFGVTSTGEVYAVAKDGPKVARLLRGGRQSLRATLASTYYERHQQPANAQALADCLLVLEGQAQTATPTEVVLRVGRSAVDRRLILDLGDPDGHVAAVGVAGWEIASSPVLLWRTKATLPLPSPAPTGDLDVLRDLLNVGDDDWPLLVAWLVACLIPDIPHPVLLLRGEHGTAKSTAAKLLTSLIDPCASQLRTAPRNVEDWAVACAGSWVTCLDNVSDLQPWLQDAICRAVTGDGLLRRQLYTDSDVTVLAFKRVIALTSIDPGRLNGDLADRLLTVELERITDDGRRADDDLAVAWRQVHPVALAGLLDLTAQVLAVLPGVRRTGLPRMADFARVLLAVDKVLGSDAYNTFAAQAGKTAEAVVEGDSVAIAIREHITQPWSGTASDLLKLLTGDKPPRDWPTTPQGMGGRLARAAPALRAVGWTVEKRPRTDEQGTRGWTIIPPAEEYPSALSALPGTSDDRR